MLHRPTHHAPRHNRTLLVGVAALVAALAGCSDSADDSDAADAPGAAPDAGSADETTDTASAATTPRGASPATPTVRSASIAVVPGWESIVDPILASIAESGDAGISFDVDLDWMDANAAEDVERRILAAVASGELDAGYVGVRALSALDVAGFDVLVAPGLVDSYELQEAALAGDVPDRLLPLLEAIDVTGVAIAPGPMRYPIGVSRPFVSPDDFAGATFHTFPGEQNAATAEALGATHSQLWGGERDDAIDAGMIDVTENTMEWMRNNGRGSHLTLEPLWPAIGVLVMNPELAGQLSTSQFEAMRSAVESASPTAAELVAADEALAVELCDAGKSFVSSADGGAAMLAALQPVYDALTADAVAGPLLTDVQALADTIDPTRPSVPTACGGSDEDPPVAVGTDDPSVLNGTYRLEWTAEELVEATGADLGEARNNDGVFVLSMEDGAFDMVWQDEPDAPCGGTYGVTGDRVQLIASTDLTAWTCGGESLGDLVMDAAWSLDGDQLVFSDFTLSDRPDITWFISGFFSKPLTRVS